MVIEVILEVKCYWTRLHSLFRSKSDVVWTEAVLCNTLGLLKVVWSFYDERQICHND